jgi:lambda family phage portal protein
MYREHPGDFQDTVDAALLKEIPADQIIHLFDPLRPGQMRGLPHLHASLVPLHELDKFTDATLLKQQLQNMFVAFLTRTGVGDASLHPLTGEALSSSTATEKPTLSLEPGTFQELDLGEDVKFSDPPDVQSGYADFTKAQLRAACTAAGVPYEVVTGDLSGLNDRIVRVILHEFRRRLQATQHQILAYQVCRRVWRAWFDRAVLSGALPMPPGYGTPAGEPYLRVKWSPQSWPYLHPVQDVEASVAAIRAGFTSRSQVVAEQGEDAEQIDNEQARDNERADESGLRYDSDGRQAKTPKNSTDESAAASGSGVVIVTEFR